MIEIITTIEATGNGNEVKILSKHREIAATTPELIMFDAHRNHVSKWLERKVKRKAKRNANSTFFSIERDKNH